MIVGENTKDVKEGDCLFIKSNKPHGLRNTEEKKLVYFGAASSSFIKEELLELWPLKSEI